MTPQEKQQFEEMKQTLKRIDNGFRNLSQIDPQYALAIKTLVFAESDALVTNYDQAVNEGGAGSYLVPSQFDGFFEVSGRLVGYYDI